MRGSEGDMFTVEKERRRHTRVGLRGSGWLLKRREEGENRLDRKRKLVTERKERKEQTGWPLKGRGGGQDGGAIGRSLVTKGRRGGSNTAPTRCLTQHIRGTGQSYVEFAQVAD